MMFDSAQKAFCVDRKAYYDVIAFAITGAV